MLPASLAAYKSTDKDWMVARMNGLGHASTPFFFMIDYACRNFVLIPLADLPVDGLAFSMGSFTGKAILPYTRPEVWHFDAQPISFEEYKSQFDQIMSQIRAGNTYLINLTCSTPLTTSLDLYDFYNLSQAAYRIWVGDSFTVFSPECFVRIKDGYICTFPMKGTIDASLPHARKRILADKKEAAEHYTIVDLLRNDLSMVARQVRVESFRYTETLQTSRKPLIQVSSRIGGVLSEDYLSHLGDILFTLLPAGSISGAPKQKTVDILQEVEHHDRTFYTGVAGVFDGKSLDSCVMIRFIEKGSDGMVFKSGGGITFMSDAASEYQEMIDKVYFPLARGLIK